MGKKSFKKLFSKGGKTAGGACAPQEKDSAGEDKSPTVSFSTQELTQTGATQIFRDEEDTLVVREELAKKKPASLVLLHGPKDMVGLSWSLVKPVTCVGRSQALNEIAVPYKSLSKSHFRILNEEGLFYLEDLKSTNKTWIDERLVSPREKRALRNNSYIKAGHLIFKFMDEGNIELLSSLQMLNKAQTDSLTGAGNRQMLKVRGRGYFVSSKRLSLIVFDVDRFKGINDSFGHRAGDHVLKELSKRVLETVRDGDMFIRYGGDEFCLFTPVRISAARRMARRMRSKIQRPAFVFEGKKIVVDISVGVAEKTPSDKNWENIFHRADLGAYRHKSGKKPRFQRNRAAG